MQKGLVDMVIVGTDRTTAQGDVCNKIGIIDRGVMTVNSAVNDIMREMRKQVVLNVMVSGDSVGAARELEQHNDVDSLELVDQQLIVTLVEGCEDYSHIPSVLVQAGYGLKLFQEEPVDLEKAFMTLTKGTGANF